MYKTILITLIAMLAGSTTCNGEDIIWRNITGTANMVPDKVVNRPPGPGMGGLRTYALANVLISPNQCDASQPGLVKQIKTYFFDDVGANGLPPTGLARLNVFQIPAGTTLPDNIDDNPDNGIDVPVTFTQVDLNGMPAIEVRADDLDTVFNPPLRIDPEVEYFIGLTPIFEEGDEFFGGNHIAGTIGVDNEKPSALRMTSPQLQPWEFAVNAAGESLFAFIEIRGIVDGPPNPPAPDVFLSFSGLGEFGAAGNTAIDGGLGSTMKAYVWVNGDVEIDTQMFLNVTSSNSGIIDITQGESFESKIFMNGSTVGVRWGGSFGPGAIGPNNQSIELMAFSGGQGTGIITANTGPVLFDQLYDPTNDAFLFGCFEFRVSSLGVTDIALSEGQKGIVHDGAVINPTFGSLVVTGNGTIGDIDGDGAINLLDVQPFIDLIANGGYSDAADTNRDGCVNLLDVNSFVEILAYGGP